MKLNEKETEYEERQEANDKKKESNNLVKGKIIKAVQY